MIDTVFGAFIVLVMALFALGSVIVNLYSEDSPENDRQSDIEGF